MSNKVLNLSQSPVLFFVFRNRLILILQCSTISAFNLASAIDSTLSLVIIDLVTLVITLSSTLLVGLNPMNIAEKVISQLLSNVLKII